MVNVIYDSEMELEKKSGAFESSTVSVPLLNLLSGLCRRLTSLSRIFRLFLEATLFRQQQFCRFGSSNRAILMLTRILSDENSHTITMAQRRHVQAEHVFQGYGTPLVWKRINLRMTNTNNKSNDEKDRAVVVVDGRTAWRSSAFLTRFRPTARCRWTNTC